MKSYLFVRKALTIPYGRAWQTTKEPAERYEDMLTFARAYQEALADAASAQAYAQQYTYASRTAGQVNDLAGAATFARSAPALDTSELRPEADKVEEPKPGQTAVITDESTHAKREGKLAGVTPHGIREGHPLAIGLVLLVLLLVLGGALGLMRVTNPCLLGMCPGMQLSTNDVNIINDDAQVVKITNPGSADLQWRRSLHLRWHERPRHRMG